MTTDLSEVAASVAKALNLVDAGDCWDVRLPQRIILRRDGSNLTDPYWFKRCIQWLHSRGYVVSLHFRLASRAYYIDGAPAQDIRIDCPADEFPARAIHELMQRKP